MFLANGITYVRAARGSRRGVPVPCFDMVASQRPLRYYPVTAGQLDAQNRVWSSSSTWQRFLIEDKATGRELPVKVTHPADAHMVAEHYAAAVVSPDPARRLDPGDPVAVSQWVLLLAARLPERVIPIPEWLVSQRQADEQAAAERAASTVWNAVRGPVETTEVLDQQVSNARPDGGHTA